MNQIKLKLLEYKSDSYEGTPYSNVLARYNGRVLKFKLDNEKVKDLSTLLDKEVIAEFDIVSGQYMGATIRLTKVELAK